MNEMVEVVIKIPKDMYDRITDEGNMFYSHAVANGTVLPKGHDALLDAGQLMNYCHNQIEGHKYVDCNVIARFPCVVKADKSEVKPNMQEPWKGAQPPCLDDGCYYYEIGEGGHSICTYDGKRIIEGEPCHVCGSLRKSF